MMEEVSAPEYLIIQGSLDDAYTLSLQIPEFEPWYSYETWQHRLKPRDAVILIAMIDNKPAGFKVGYYADDHFYSWVGGVVPEYRRLGLALKLATVQEEIVKNSGVSRIRMKTRNRFRGMLLFALQRGFYITDVDQRGEPQDWRIGLTKNI
jgi:ribosomal protein S18 acetylase RimI-like enzyme